MIGDDQIKELRRSKPSLQEAQIRALAVALENFKTSPRYEILKTVALTQFIKGAPGGLKSLKSKPLGEIVESGVFKVCKSAKLTNASIKKLSEIFFRLQGDPATTPPAVKAKVFSLPHLRAVSDRKPAAAETISMSSVEAEEKLETAIRRLRLSPRFQDISDNRLGDYWDRAIVSAPFEESLTFRQFSEMKVRALLEKRSFGMSKIQGVLAAIDKALRTGENAPPVQPGPASVSNAGADFGVQAAEAAPTLWAPSERPLARHGLMLLRLYEHQVARAALSTGPLAKLLREIPSRLLAHEFLTTWFLQEYHEDIVARIMSVDRSEVLTVSDIAYKKLDRLVSVAASELRSYWEIALRGPGIGSEKLIEIFREPLLDEDFQIGICQILLSSTGARHPIVFGEDLSQYWSKSPSALQMSITALISSLPKSNDALLEEVDALFPFFDKAVILSVLRRQAFYREREKLWVKRSDTSA